MRRPPAAPAPPSAAVLALTAVLALAPAAAGGLTVSAVGTLPGGVPAAADAAGRPAKRTAVAELLGPDADRVVAAQYAADQGGNTSVRNAADPKWKDKGYFRRSRDLGQVFTPEEAFTLDAILLRTGNGYLAWGEQTAGAKVFVQFFEVAGEPRVDDNATPAGTASTHGFSDHHRTDDKLVGVTYKPLFVARGGALPELPGEGKLHYLKWDLTGEDERAFEAGRRYAFLVGFEEPAGGPGARNFTLANNNLAAADAPADLGAGPDAYAGGWGLRREGKGKPPELIPGPTPPADPRVAARLRSQSAFPTGPDRFAGPPTTDGYPDVDTYRDLEFYLLAKAEDGAAAGEDRTAAAGPADGWVEDHLPGLVKLYTELHAAPELSKQEKQTAATLAGLWREAGYKVTTDVGGHGLVGVLKNGDGPTLMLRCDLDGLPVTERTGVPYASTVTVERPDGGATGVMHACGHDIHMTTVTGAGRFLAENKGQWAGTVMLLGQPAEETGTGAKAMLDDGLFERFPKPDYAVALHVSPTVATGDIEAAAGYSLANVDSVDVTFTARGGHGAQPHTTVDPVVVAAQFITSVQAVVAREVQPTEPAVITVGSIHAGTKHNIIPPECRLQLTVRSYSDEVREQLLNGIERRAKAAAAAAGAEEPTVETSEGTPSLYNDDELTARLKRVFADVLGEDAVGEGEPSMGGEDFSRYGREGVPTLMYRLGTVPERDLMRYEKAGVAPPSLHTSTYAPAPEASLRTGLRTMTAAALDLLAPGAGGAAR